MDGHQLPNQPHHPFIPVSPRQNSRTGDVSVTDVWGWMTAAPLMDGTDLHEGFPTPWFPPLLPTCEGSIASSWRKSNRPQQGKIQHNWLHLVRSVCLTNIPCRLRREGPILRGPCARHHGILSIMLEVGRVTMQCSENWRWSDGQCSAPE